MTVLIQTSLLVKLDELQVCQLAQNFFVWKSLIDEPFERWDYRVLLSSILFNLIIFKAMYLFTLGKLYT